MKHGSIWRNSRFFSDDLCEVHDFSGVGMHCDSSVDKKKVMKQFFLSLCHPTKAPENYLAIAAGARSSEPPDK